MIFTLFTNCLISILLIIFGVVSKLWPPEHINKVYGYRTPFSMKNIEIWHEGNHFSSIMMIYSGIVSLVFSILVTILYKNNEIIARKISLLGSVIIILCFILYTEIHLKKVFDKNGNKK